MIGKKKIFNLRMAKDIADAVEVLAYADRRSFTGEVNALLEFAIVQRRIIEDRMPENTKMDAITKASFRKLIEFHPPVAHPVIGE